jgi:hypothetical protein
MLKSAHQLETCLSTLGGKTNQRIKNNNIDWNEWYRQYRFYYSNWENYFNKIALPQITSNFILIFWESSPGGMPFPHQNYIFNQNTINAPMHGIFDMYLRVVCNKFKIPWNGSSKMTRNAALDELAKRNVIVIDLFPTHGISLNNSERNSLYHQIFNTYSLKFLDHIKTEIFINKGKICSKVYSPSLVHKRLTKNHKTEITKVLGGPVVFNKL